MTASRLLCRYYRYRLLLCLSLRRDSTATVFVVSIAPRAKKTGLFIESRRSPRPTLSPQSSVLLLRATAVPTAQHCKVSLRCAAPGLPLVSAFLFPPFSPTARSPTTRTAAHPPLPIPDRPSIQFNPFHPSYSSSPAKNPSNFIPVGFDPPTLVAPFFFTAYYFYFSLCLFIYHSPRKPKTPRPSAVIKNAREAPSIDSRQLRLATCSALEHSLFQPFSSLFLGRMLR